MHLTERQVADFRRDGCVHPIRVLSAAEAAGYRRRLVAGGDRPQQLGVQARHLGQVVQLLVMHEVEAPRQRVERRDRLRGEPVSGAARGEALGDEVLAQQLGHVARLHAELLRAIATGDEQAAAVACDLQIDYAASFAKRIITHGF